HPSSVPRAATTPTHCCPIAPMASHGPWNDWTACGAGPRDPGPAPWNRSVRSPRSPTTASSPSCARVWTHVRSSPRSTATTLTSHPSPPDSPVNATTIQETFRNTVERYGTNPSGSLVSLRNTGHDPADPRTGQGTITGVKSSDGMIIPFGMEMEVSVAAILGSGVWVFDDIDAEAAMGPIPEPDRHRI